MASSSAATKPPPLARTASNICFQRTGAAMEMPSASVSSGVISGTAPRFSSHMRTIGAHRAAWAAKIFGSSPM